MKEFGAVMGAGAFGGLLSWVWTITLGVELERLPRALAVLACILLGAGAAVIGIYVIAKTDRRDLPHALGFAILCGFSWQLVYEAGLSTLNRRDARKQVEQRASSAATAETTLASATTPEVKVQALDTLADDAAALLGSSKEANSKEAEKKAVEVSVSALETIEKSAPATAPDITAIAVEQIADAAIDAGHPEVTDKAVETLKAGGVTEKEATILRRIAIRDPRLRASIGTIQATTTTPKLDLQPDTTSTRPAFEIRPDAPFSRPRIELQPSNTTQLELKPRTTTTQQPAAERQPQTTT